MTEGQGGLVSLMLMEQGRMLRRNSHSASLAAPLPRKRLSWRKMLSLQAMANSCVADHYPTTW